MASDSSSASTIEGVPNQPTTLIQSLGAPLLETLRKSSAPEVDIDSGSIGTNAIQVRLLQAFADLYTVSVIGETAQLAGSTPTEKSASTTTQTRGEEVSARVTASLLGLTSRGGKPEWKEVANVLAHSVLVQLLDTTVR